MIEKPFAILANGTLVELLEEEEKNTRFGRPYFKARCLDSAPWATRIVYHLDIAGRFASAEEAHSRFMRATDKTRPFCNKIAKKEREISDLRSDAREAFVLDLSKES